MKKITILLLFLLSTAAIRPAIALGWSDMKRIEKQIVAPVFPEIEFHIGDFGAAGNGIDDDRPAIQAAIDSCSNRGGGHVVLPAGRYFSRGPIVLKNDVDLHLSKGAELIFSADERDYLPVVLTRWEGTELFNYSPLIYARNMQNIAVTGHGTINGQGSRNFATWKPRQKADQQALRKQGREGAPLHERVYGEGHWLRPAMLELVSCSGVLIENIRIINAPFWSIHPLCCNNITVRGVTVDSTNLNNDGCDPESCRNVLIEDCYFHTGDDAIAIKSGRDNEAWHIGQPTENVIIRRCTFDTEINGLCIGSEISGGVRNVFAEDIHIMRASHGLYFKSNLDRGGYIEGIWIRRIRVDRIDRALVKFEPDYKSESKENHPTRFRDFVLERIHANDVRGIGLDIGGFEHQPVRDVVIRNLEIDHAQTPVSIRNTENLTLQKVFINGNRYDRNNR